METSHQAVIKFERESRKITVSGFVFDIPAFYEMSRLLGKGAYGCVVAAVDTRNGANIAIKRSVKPSQIRKMRSVFFVRFA